MSKVVITLIYAFFLVIFFKVYVYIHIYRYTIYIAAIFSSIPLNLVVLLLAPPLRAEMAHQSGIVVLA